MSPSARVDEKQNWYKINVDTVRGASVFLLLMLMAAGGFLGYRVLQSQFLEREVEIVIAEAQELVESLRGEEGISAYDEEYETAQVSLEQARANAAAGDLGEALRDAEHSRSLLTSILNALRHRGPAGEAQFIAVQGAVEYRRGESGEWQPARSRVTLYAGDYVKTSESASSEVMFQDGTVVTVRPDTVILVDRSRSLLGFGGERTVGLEYGWVNLSTAAGVSKVRTPSASALVRQDSQALVAYDEEAKVGRFATYQGNMEVSTDTGRTEQVAELQQVTQSGQTLSKPRPLPAIPALATPADGEVFGLEVAELVLTWREVPGAERYALQVSRSQHFVDNIIDVDDRDTLKATLGLRGEGSFMWRVAAFGNEGVMGPWSAPRGFRVASRREPTTG
ncbi:MAG: hypothetical protein ACE5EG_09105 [Thermoanaerobaculia bacterium]